MSLVWTRTFETGTDGGTITAGTEGTSAVSGTVQYEADAAIHGSMGVRLQAAGAASMGWAATSEGQFSVYWGGYTIGTFSCVIASLRNSGTHHARLRANSTTGKYEVTNAANAVVATSTSDIDPLVPGRADIRWAYNSGTGELTVIVRLFLDTNIEGTTPDETMSPAAFVIPSAINRVYIGTHAGTWTLDVDSLRLYDDIVTWPEPFGAAPSAAAVVYTMSGGIEDTTATIKAKVSDTDDVKVYYSVNADLSSPTYTIAQAIDGDGYGTWSLTGLTPNTKYYYNFLNSPGGGGSETSFGTTYSFRTLPAPTSTGTIKLAIGSCIDTAAPGAHDALLDIVSWDPHRFVQLGDMYYNGNSGNTLASQQRALWESQLENVDDLRELLGKVGLVYINSDHELNPDNVDTLSSANALSFNEFYRQTIPSFPLVVTGTDPISKHQSWVDSNIRFIMLDVRNTQRSIGTNTDGPGKTMLGAAQLAWLLDELDQPELLKVVFCDVPWTRDAIVNPTNADKWWSYANERQIIADHITTNDINVDFFHGDSHRLSVDQTHNTWGGFPTSSCAPLSQNSGGTQSNGYWDESYPVEGGGSIAEMSVYMRVTYEWLDADTLRRTCSGWDAIADVQRVSMVTTWVREASPPSTTFIRSSGGAAIPTTVYRRNSSGDAVPVVSITQAP